MLRQLRRIYVRAAFVVFEVDQGIRMMIGVDDSLFGNNNLVIMPRLPRNWDGEMVNGWPAIYKNGSNVLKTNVTFDYTKRENQAYYDNLKINGGTITGAKLRFGPFDPYNFDTTNISYKIDGVTQPLINVTTEQKGDSMWVWVSGVNIGTSAHKHTISGNIPCAKIVEDFDLSGTTDLTTAGWTPTGGTWAIYPYDPSLTYNSNHAGGVLWSDGTGTQVLTNSYTANNGSLYVKSDVSTNSGTAQAGICMLANAAGTTGYKLTMDMSTGNLSLRKGGIATTPLASANCSLKPNRTYTLASTIIKYGSDNYIACYLDGVLVFEYYDVGAGTTVTSGKVGVISKDATEVWTSFDNILVLN